MPNASIWLHKINYGVQYTCVQEAKKKARKMRFQMGLSGNTDEILAEALKKKQQRLERFGGA